MRLFYKSILKYSTHSHVPQESTSSNIDSMLAESISAHQTNKCTLYRLTFVTMDSSPVFIALTFVSGFKVVAPALDTRVRGALVNF